MAKKGKRVDWFKAQDDAFARYAQRTGVRWPGPEYAIARGAFCSGFAAGLRAMRRHLKKAGTP